MQFDQPLREREAQARPFVLPRQGRVHLAELLEERGQVFRGDPDPRVGDADHHGFPVQPPIDRDAAAGVRELDGVREQVIEDLLQLQRIGREFDRPRGDVGPDFDPLAAREGPRDADDLVHEGPEFTGLERQFHGPRLDLREVQDVVDHAEELPPSLVDVGGELALFRRRVARDAVADRLREPHDRVQGRPEFVAHVGQELALELVGPDEFRVDFPQFGGFPGHHPLQVVGVLAQPRLEGPILGDVAADDRVTDGPAVGIGSDRHDVPHGEPLAVLAEAYAFALVPPMDPQGPFQVGAGHRGGLFGGRQTLHRTIEHLFRFVTEDAAGPFIERQHAPLRVRRDDGVLRGRVEDRMEEVHGLAEFPRPLLDAALQPLVHLAQVALHPAQRLRQLPHLVARADRDVQVQVTLADPACGVRETLQRPRDAADEPQAQPDRGDHAHEVAPGEILPTRLAAHLRKRQVGRQAALDGGRRQHHQDQFVGQFQAAHDCPVRPRAPLHLEMMGAAARFTRPPQRLLAASGVGGRTARRSEAPPPSTAVRCGSSGRCCSG